MKKPIGVTIHCIFYVGDEENIEKFNRRLVKVSKQHNEECKELLKFMGIPYIEVSDRNDVSQSDCNC